jgi:hypothetical protein
MNVISYINGDSRITDNPKCSARPLARMVQCLNDRLAGPDGYLSPEDSLTVLDLGWLTVGTADVPETVVFRWLSELLVDPSHGVVLHAFDADAAVRRVAELCDRAGNGEIVESSEWNVAHRSIPHGYPSGSRVSDLKAAGAVACAASEAARVYSNAVSDSCACCAAYYSYAAKTHVADTDGLVDFIRWAITRWRQIAGLDDVSSIDPIAVDAALEKIG